MIYINHDLRCVDGRTLYMPPWIGGEENWGNLELPNILANDETQQYPLGTKYVEGNRVYRYVQADADRQLRAAYGVAPDIRYNETGNPTEEAVAGQKVVSLTEVATVDVNEFAGGKLAYNGIAVVALAPSYEIQSNTVAVGGTYTVTLMENLIAPIYVGDTVTLFHSPWRRVFSQRQRAIDGVATDARKGAIVGVPARFVTLNYYCWIQTYGDCIVVGDSGTEGTADGERCMVFSENGSVKRLRDLGDELGRLQLAGFVLPVTTTGNAPNLEIMLQICP